MAEYGSIPTAEKAEGDSPTFTKPRKFNDVCIALVFILQLIAVILSGVKNDVASEDVDLSDLPTEGDWMTKKLGVETYTNPGVIKFVAIISALTVIISVACLMFMVSYVKKIVPVSIVFGNLVILAVFWFACARKIEWLMWGSGLYALYNLIMSYFLWKKIPFTAANLKTAITAIQTNFGLVFVACILQFVTLIWTVVWLDAATANLSGGEASGWIGFFYLVSFFWVQETLTGIQHTIVASVLGTWWYNPVDANFCWDDGLNDALAYSFTYSFGSIAYGGALAGLVKAIKRKRHTSEYRETNCCGGCGRCCQFFWDCICTCNQDFLDYFNRWSFTFVGIHGDSYMASGRSVVAMFKERGWKLLINDYLAEAVMVTMKRSVALISGLLGWWLVNFDDDIFEPVGIPSEYDDFLGFVCGGLIGYAICGIMMEVVDAAVCAIFVCLGESPEAFAKNYPELCSEMVAAWKSAYPNEVSDDFAAITKEAESA